MEGTTSRLERGRYWRVEEIGMEGVTNSLLHICKMRLCS
jgi:hypothetical protein